MNITLHLQQRKIEREINRSLGNLYSYAENCTCDTAIILERLDKELNIAQSNGDLIIMIVRNHKIITVMYRRSKNQPLTKQALRVDDIKDYSH
jgi:hypothetical protein